MGVSILDIAALAGVSKSTVSAVINQHPHVRQETRERVLDAIRQLDYHPNIAARELITSAPMNIGVIMPSYRNEMSNSGDRYFQGIDEGSNLELVSQLIEKVSTTRYGVLVEHSTITDGEIQLPSFALSRRVAGVFQISPLFSQAYVEKLCQYVPTMVEIGVPSARCDCVYSDFAETGRRSVDYLAKLGHKRIAFINCDPASRTADMRLEGYLSGLQRNRLSYEPKWVSVQRLLEQAFCKPWLSALSNSLLAVRPLEFTEPTSLGDDSHSPCNKLVPFSYHLGALDRKTITPFYHKRQFLSKEFSPTSSLS